MVDLYCCGDILLLEICRCGKQRHLPIVLFVGHAVCLLYKNLHGHYGQENVQKAHITDDRRICCGVL
jgi:hypothetical protein